MSRLAGLMAVIAVATAADAQELTRTQRGHLEAPRLPGLEAKPPVRQSVDKAQPILLLKSDKPYWKVLRHDPVLSSGCRNGTFDTNRPNRFVARFTGKEGAAVMEAVPASRRDLLIDNDKLARPDEHYFFLGAGWSNCEVYYLGKLPPRIKK